MSARRPPCRFKIPEQTWEQYVHQQERQEYDELVEYGLRRPYSELPKTSHGDRYLDFLDRIGDDKDGFYEPIRMAVWHWARANSEADDEAFKTALRQVVHEARCSKQRDLDEYLSDYRLNASLRGARDKLPAPKSALERYRDRLRFSLSHSRKEH